MQNTLEALSVFGQAAVKLDAVLRTYDQLANELEHLEVASDKGLARGQTLLKEVDEARTRLGAEMQNFAQHLQASRERCDQVEAVIASRTDAVNDRLQLADGLFKRFQILGEMVHAITLSLASLKKSDDTEALSSEEKTEMASRLPEFNEKISILIDEAKKLVGEARDSNLKSLEQNADSMHQTLQSAQNKFNLYIEKQTGAASLH